MATTCDDLLKVLNNMQMRADQSTRDLNSKIEDISKKVDNVKIDALEKEKRDEQKLEGIYKRLELIEKNMIRDKDKCEERNKIAREQKNRTDAFKDAVGLDKEQTTEIVKKTPTWSELVEKNKKEDEEKKEEAKRNAVKHWRKQVKITVREDKKDEKKVEENIVVTEAEIKKKLKEEKRIEELKGDSSGHEEDDWSWEESDGNWDGTEDRNEREKKKKIERYRKKKMLEEKTARRGKHMLTLGPIRRQSVGYFHDATADYALAKVMAVNEFLGEYLQFTEDDIRDFEVIDTMLAKNEEEVMHVTFADHEAVKEIHRRVAELKNDDITARRYIPPQFWKRFSHLNKFCQKLREEDDELKTIIRFNEKDLEVLTKNRRTEDQYTCLPLSEIEKQGPIPKFDHTIVWKKRVDRQPRNPVKPVKGKICPPSIRQTESQRNRSKSPSQLDLPTKRQKQTVGGEVEEEDMDL